MQTGSKFFATVRIPVKDRKVTMVRRGKGGRVQKVVVTPIAIFGPGDVPDTGIMAASLIPKGVDFNDDWTLEMLTEDLRLRPGVRCRALIQCNDFDITLNFSRGARLWRAVCHAMTVGPFCLDADSCLRSDVMSCLCFVLPTPTRCPNPMPQS